MILEPRNQEDAATILEFKVQDSDDEKELSDTVNAALRQIRDKNYAAALKAKGIPENNIRMYGFAFCGKKVLIGTDNESQETIIERDEEQIRTFIENGQEFGVSRSEILKKLAGKFELDRETAEQKMKEYWKNIC